MQWENRKKGDIGNDCLVSINGADFCIPHAGRNFCSHKCKASGLRCEVAVCILSGECMWINGPFEPGMHNDIEAFHSALIDESEEGERVEADDGHNGEAPRCVKTPNSVTQRFDTDLQQSLVRRRQETINKRFKQFGVLKQIFRHDVRDHGKCFRSVAVVAQLSIQHGEPPFSVDCKDPHLDDFCHPENLQEDDES